MNQSIVRTDRWMLNPSEEAARYLELTTQEFQAFCKALAYVVKAHWSKIFTATSQCSAVERLIHATSVNLNPKYSYFDRRFYKFPSYLRRAAIEFVCGQVSSFYSRYWQWQGGNRKHRAANPPGFNISAGCYPALYKGQLIKFHDNQNNAEIKVWNGSDWIWTIVPIVSKRGRHTVDSNKQLSPSLIQSRKGFHLSVPFRCHPKKLKSDIVCAVDVGINTLATVSIVDSSGTVIARRFIHPAVDIDRRNKQAMLIRQAAKKTKKLHKGFCSNRYRKARQYNRNIANQTAHKVVNFALEHGASVIVLEDLKHWKPKGRGSLKQRFHWWLHRAFAQKTEEMFVEVGGKVEYVYARGTSSWAYDGSGEVKRSKKNYSLATFQSGRQFNADLSASYNIAARYWAWKLKLTRRNDGQLPSGKSSRGKRRMPVTLSLLWDRDATFLLPSNEA